MHFQIDDIDKFFKMPEKLYPDPYPHNLTYESVYQRAMLMLDSLGQYPEVITEADLQRIAKAIGVEEDIVEDWIKTWGELDDNYITYV